MKKQITFFLIVAAAMAQAASISWTWEASAKIKYNTTSVSANATAYLLFLGSDALSAYSFDEYVTMAQDTSAASKVVTTATTAMSKIGTNAIVDDTTGLGNYATVLSYVSADKTYWNVSGTLFTLTKAAVDKLKSEGTEIASSFDFSSTVSTGTGTVGGGWAQAVPEPATGALALAGIALLFKRRKARA